MFSKANNKLPKLVEFTITQEDFLNDCSAIARDSDNRNKLYECIDNKLPPTDSRLSMVKEFLSDNTKFEEILKELHTQHDQMKQRKVTLEEDRDKIISLLSKQ